MRATFPRLLLLGVLLGLFGAARPAAAHDESLSSSEVDITAREVVWRVDVGVAGLGKVISLPAPEGQLDEAGFRTAAPAIGRYLLAGVELRAGGVLLAGQVRSIEPDHETGPGGGRILGRAIATMVFSSPTPITELRARVRFFADLTSQHRAIVRVKWGHDVRRFTRLGPTELILAAGEGARSTWALLGELARWGAHHIFVGYDHIAFLLALLLAVSRFRELVKIVTSFTIAHSVTLLLAALEVVTIPSRLTEILIAASIVYVAVENLRTAGRPLPHRWLVTFAFGLVHGLGFATELRHRLAELGGAILLPVLSFNLGVEAGQLAIVALVFPLLARLRGGAPGPETFRRQQRVVRMGSVPILLLGLYWMIDRLAG